jgi:NAD(P)-dependent dehydrogenase (short-subunit alcohol dehydrogenase family)
VLANKAVVVPVGLSADQTASVARRLAAEGAAVVLVAGQEHPEAGRLAAELAARAPARSAVFVLTGDDTADLDALVELLAELFP